MDYTMVLEIKKENNSQKETVNCIIDIEEELLLIFKNLLWNWDDKFTEFLKKAEISSTQQEYEKSQEEFRRYYYTEKISIIDSSNNILRKVITEFLLILAEKMVRSYKNNKIRA